MSSTLDIFTRVVSTSLVIANVFILDITSLSLFYGFADAPLGFWPLSFFLFELTFSRTPTVNWPRDVISSAKDC